MVTVNQSRMPGLEPIGEKVVQRGSEKKPAPSSGTPRTTLPSAAPKKMISTALAAKKTASQNPAHISWCTRWWNSMATARSISSHSTMNSGR